MVQYRVPREELPYDPANRKSIVEYAQKLVGRTLRDACDVDSFQAKGEQGQTWPGNRVLLFRVRTELRARARFS